jgi:hypothetical protein
MMEHGLRFPVEEHPAMLWRGALALTSEPPEIFRHGRPLDLSPAETALMALLIRRGRAAHCDIAKALAHAGASIASLDVITYRIRRKFAGAGAGDPIKTRRRWGLVLRVEPDVRGSKALWIGTRPDAPGYWTSAAAPPPLEAERRL